MNDWMTDWLTDWLTDWMTDLPTDWPTDQPTERAADFYDETILWVNSVVILITMGKIEYSS